MDILSLLRTLGALIFVLGLLGGALWLVRRYDITLPGRVSSSGRRRIEMVERFSIDAKRSVALIRRDNAEHLILIAPDGHVMIETGIVRQPAPEPEPAATPPEAPAFAVDAEAPVQVTKAVALGENIADLRIGFGQLVDQARARLKVPARA